MEQKEKIELSPCPFCDSKQIVVGQEFNHINEKIFFGWCLYCGCRSKKHFSEDRAVLFWNTRIPHDALMERANIAEAALVKFEQLAAEEIAGFNALQAKADCFDEVVGAIEDALAGYEHICSLCNTKEPRPCKCKWQPMKVNLIAVITKAKKL